MAVLGFVAMVLGFGVYCATHSVDFPVYHQVAAQIARGDYEIYPTAVSVLLLAYFAWRRRFGLCAATLVVLLIIAILPGFVVGYRMNNHLLEGFGKYALQKIDEGDNYALRGLLLGTGLSSQAVTWVWVLTVLTGTVAVVVALWPHPAAPTTRVLESAWC